MKIPAGQFKAKCLQLMDEVQETGQEIIVTKHGKPVARLVPMHDESKRTAHGFMKGLATVLGDIVAPVSEKWDADE